MKQAIKMNKYTIGLLDQEKDNTTNPISIMGKSFMTGGILFTDPYISGFHVITKSKQTLKSKSA